MVLQSPSMKVDNFQAADMASQFTNGRHSELIAATEEEMQ